MEKLLKSIKGVITVALVFFIPRFFMTGGSDLETVKQWLNGKQANASVEPATSSPDSKPEAEKPAPPPPIVIDPEKIENKDDVLLPTPSEAKLSPITPITEILRFDYDPVDIVKKWPYVTAANPELYLQAYRAPLVTGAQNDDLAGVITYFFDMHTVQQISIRAKTGDFRKLVAHLQKYYGFVQRETQTPAIYIYQQPETFARKDGSYLWIRPNLAFAEGIEQHRFDVTLVLNRPKK